MFSIRIGLVIATVVLGLTVTAEGYRSAKSYTYYSDDIEAYLDQDDDYYEDSTESDSEDYSWESNFEGFSLEPNSDIEEFDALPKPRLEYPKKSSELLDTTMEGRRHYRKNVLSIMGRNRYNNKLRKRGHSPQGRFLKGLISKGVSRVSEFYTTMKFLTTEFLPGMLMQVPGIVADLWKDFVGVMTDKNYVVQIGESDPVTERDVTSSSTDEKIEAE